jgi:aryl sulfotransferase
LDKTLILVAGYPKSGSTWVRLVFETLQRGQAVSINEMSGGYYGARRRMLFDAAAPVNAGDLLADEIDDVLPGVFRALSAEPGGPHIVKVHDCAFQTRSQEWLYPPDRVHKVVYLTRHPFDVAVSYAHHLGISIRDAVGHMGTDETVAISAARLRLPLHERVGSWSGNVRSWLEAVPYDIVPMRYEDLFADPVARFVHLVKEAGWRGSEADVARATEAARFERLQGEEKSTGFVERPRSSPVFFRAGRPHSWQGALGDDLRAKLMEDHAEVMARLGYDADGNARAAPQWRAIA